MKSRLLAAACTSLLAFAPGLASAQFTDNAVKIGIMNDMSGVYSDFQGAGSLLAAKMAVQDFGGKVKGVPVEVLSADHQNKTDIGLARAREWIDQSGVDAIMDVPNSGIALAVHELVREKNKVFVAAGGATAELTGPKCSPNTVHWVSDTWANANSIARAVTTRGGKDWFFITADYAFGHDLEKNAANAVKDEGGKVLGNARMPLNTQDYASSLLQAQSSKAQIVGLANAGGDTTNSIKQAAEFGLTKGGQKMAGLMFLVNNVQSLGLDTAQGLLTVAPFYWDMNERTREFSKRFSAQHPNGNMPNEYQAGVYSAVLHYLKALDALGSDSDGKAVVAKMKQIPTDDPIFGKGTIREDGRKLHPMYLLEVKSPSESKGKWDYFKVLNSVPGEKAFRPIAEGGCPLAK